MTIPLTLLDESLFRDLTPQETKQSFVIADMGLKDWPIVHVSDEFAVQTGYGRDEVLGKNCRFLQGRDTDPRSVALIRTALENHEALEIPLLNYRKDGSPFWNLLKLRPHCARNGQVTHFFGFQRPVSQQQVYESIRPKAGVLGLDDQQ